MIIDGVSICIKKTFTEHEALSSKISYFFKRFSVATKGAPVYQITATFRFLLTGERQKYWPVSS